MKFRMGPEATPPGFFYFGSLRPLWGLCYTLAP